MGAKRCEATWCGRFVPLGERRCRIHGDATEPSAVPGLGRVTGEDEVDGRDEERERRDRVAAEFRRRVEAGDYRGLFGPGLAEVLTQAAADRNLTDEIGALRVVLARLLVEEEDATRLAAGVARAAGVAVQAARAQRAIGGGLADGLSEALTQILVELDE